MPPEATKSKNLIHPNVQGPAACLMAAIWWSNVWSPHQDFPYKQPQEPYSSVVPVDCSISSSGCSAVSFPVLLNRCKFSVFLGSCWLFPLGTFSAIGPLLSSGTKESACSIPPDVLLYPRTKGVKRGVSKVYLTLKYLEDNIYNVHLQSLH